MCRSVDLLGYLEHEADDWWVVDDGVMIVTPLPWYGLTNTYSIYLYYTRPANSRHPSVLFTDIFRRNVWSVCVKTSELR